MTTEDRKAFEEWVRTHSSFVLDRYGDGYFHGHVDAHWRTWQAATARERERCATWQPIAAAPKDGTPILCFTPDDDFSPVTGIDVLWWDDGAWLYDDDPVAFQPTHWMSLPVAPLVAHETTTNSVVDHKSENIEHKPEPSADLAERVTVLWDNWWSGSDEDADKICDQISALAADHAAEVTGDMASRFADDVAFWKERANSRALYIDKLKARAEAAEHALEEKTIAYSRAMESRQHWRERAEIAERTRSDLIKAARAEEREACATVAEESADESNRRYEAKAGGEDGMDRNAARYRTALNIAAAIRARKGGEND